MKLLQSNSDSRWLRPLRSLRFRLIASVVLIIVVISSLGLYLNYRREYRTHVDEQLASLTEQARALREARHHIRSPEDFAAYVDAFCAQMNENISPGHHILVLAPDGTVVVRARHHSGAEVGNALLTADPSEPIITMGDRRLAQVRLSDADGTTFVLAQFLDRVEEVLRTQMLSRAVATAATGLAIILLIYLAMERWVLGPVARLKTASRRWARRDFAAQADPTGPPDLASLAERFNAMAAELGHHERERRADLGRAKAIQANLLPKELPHVEGLSLAADYRPAADVAGDLYDVFELPDGRTALAILDVAGHGIAAALLTGVVKMSLHRRLAEQADPARAIELVNQDLLACASEGQFVTAFVGVWDSGNSTLTYCSAGHPPGLLLADGKVCPLEPTGPLLGVFATDQWAACQTELAPGSRLFLYTDGVVDAGAETEPLGQAGLVDQLAKSNSRPLAEQVEAVVTEALARNGARAADDITLLALEAHRPR